MKKTLQLVVLGLILPMCLIAQKELNIVPQGLSLGETLNYKITWGLLTIGSASTKIDNQLYKVGSNVCCKVDITGQTNGLAELFYVRDKWTSYIDTINLTTHKSFRSIREGNYELDEHVSFDHIKQKAEVKVYDKKSKTFKVKDVYDTPTNVRDIVAGFMVFRFVDLNKYSKGDIFTINGFFEDEGYKINVSYIGKEYIKTNSGKILCYKVKPIVPKNKVFNGRDAVDVWLSADENKTIVRLRAKMFVGNFNFELQ